MIIDETLLQLFREAPRCERCWRRGTLEPHHLFSRGYESVWRFDIRANLISLCGECHRAFHDGRVPAEELLALVAKREQTTPQKIVEAIWALRRDHY